MITQLLCTIWPSYRLSVEEDVRGVRYGFLSKQMHQFKKKKHGEEPSGVKETGWHDLKIQSDGNGYKKKRFEKVALKFGIFLSNEMFMWSSHYLKKSPNLSEEFKDLSSFFKNVLFDEQIGRYLIGRIFSEANFTLVLSLKGCHQYYWIQFWKFCWNKAHWNLFFLCLKLFFSCCWALWKLGVSMLLLLCSDVMS